MIMLASESLIMQTPGGELIPCSAELVSIELVGGNSSLDQDIINNAAISVLHYFKVELCRDTVTLAEFSEALERVLKKFGVSVQSKLKDTPPSPATPTASTTSPAANSSLAELAKEVGDAGQLAFFPRLRDTVRSQLEQAPSLVCFSDLRACVKQLTGARRWCPRCQTLGDDIVEFLRGCLSNEIHGRRCALLVR